MRNRGSGCLTTELIFHNTTTAVLIELPVCCIATMVDIIKRNTVVVLGRDPGWIKSLCRRKDGGFMLRWALLTRLVEGRKKRAAD